MVAYPPSSGQPREQSRDGERCLHERRALVTRREFLDRYLQTARHSRRMFHEVDVERRSTEDACASCGENEAHHWPPGPSDGDVRSSRPAFPERPARNPSLPALPLDPLVPSGCIFPSRFVLPESVKASAE